MRNTSFILVLVTVLIVSLAIVLPSKPDLPNYQGMEHFTRNGQSINGTATWTITEIDPAYFSYLSNATIIKLRVYGNLTNSKNSSVYINDHFLGTVNTSESIYNWTVPVGFCNSTTVIKITSEEWNVKSVDLMIFVEIPQVPPWWKQNILVILLAVFVEIGVVAISARKVIKWIKA
jgi:hypothetical protein